ncbi:MAG: valine--tRNA ligase [Candidatus Rokubacteria bacterium]|nr:valine--tRNA ligase [Candidatus Rokubacteria bacterium]
MSPVPGKPTAGPRLSSDAVVLPDRYDPRQVEERWYRTWEERGYFRADPFAKAKPYAIVIPPPNVTGSLHIGHALNNTLQDILVRWKRMEGFNTLWQPGTDHAGIATQFVVERRLAAEGTTKEALGREAFVKRVWQWKEDSGGTIVRQLKRLGASCDWERERFTMDPGLSAAVREVFVRLWEEGLIYRGDYIVNWCLRCRTVLSDLEVEHEERDAELYYIKYGPLTLATVRPETKLGDTALAVHPQDKRYAQYVGQTVTIQSVEGTIRMRVVADAAVDPKFGTGVVKVTPGHDPADFEIGRRHDLEVRQVIDFDGKMNALAGKYAGLDRFEARRRIVEDMRALGLIEKTEPYRHRVGVCYRCKTSVEPLVSKQWYLRMKPLAEPATKAVREGRTRIVPRLWVKTYYAWMENIRDWCLSRQLWWGHRLPVWYCDAEGTTHVSREDLTECPHCRGPLRQDEDVLDTWFSSALWPFSTLGWPRETPELRTFYPTSCLVTAYDILFFWVARMTMMGLRMMGDVPFRDVYIHALVRDVEGQKMSKSRGNAIDPLEVMDQYGTDALRFTLAALAAQGREIRLSTERIEGYRNFANKIWNAARFVLSNLGGHRAALARQAPPGLAERWIRSRLARTVVAVRRALAAYRFNEAASAIYQFLWHEYCDWYVEWSKLVLYHGDDPAARARAQATLVEVLETTLRLLHPFMPYLTEEVWQRLPKGRRAPASIMIARFPRPKRREIDPAVEGEMGLLMAVVGAVRNVRSEMQIPPGRPLTVVVRPSDADRASLLEGARAPLAALARAELFVDPAAARPPQSALALADGCEVYIPLEGVVDFAAERRRLTRELARAEEELARLAAKLARAEFRERAPAEVVAREESRRAEQVAARDKLRDALERLDAMDRGRA